MKAVKIILKVLLGIAAFILLAAIVLFAGYKITDIYNAKFPEKYISQKFPDAFVIGSGYKGGFMFDKGHLCYKLQDKNSGMRFEQEFQKSGIFGKLAPCGGENSFEKKSAQYETENELITAAENCLEAENFIIHNPLDTMGIVIFAKNESAGNVDALMRTLNEKITEMRGREEFTYAQYTVICCGEKLFDKCKSAYFSNIDGGKSGQCDFYDIAEFLQIDCVRTTAKSVDTLDVQTYNDCGDPSDPDYIPPENFDETAACIIGEYNSLGDQHFWIFGVNF